jgi:hypothetical protein
MSYQQGQTLTLQDLKDMEPGIFATGTINDGPTGINMTRSERTLRWVATRGGIHDWAIYIAPEDWSAEAVKRSGDKVHNDENIKKLVACDDEAFGMYRH